MQKVVARKIVAIVDDDSSARTAMASLLAALGYRTRVFADPLVFLASDTPHVSALILDLRLPRMSGLELHRRLQARGVRVPTVLVTAYPDSVTRAAALAAGMRAYLAKPVTPEGLVAALEGPPA